MGRKADLAVELKVALAERVGASDLGGWLERNADQITQALEWADDLVEIQEIKVCDLPQLLTKPGRD